LPDSGEIILDGENCSKHVQYIGYLPEERLIYKYEVVEQCLYLAQMKGLSKEQKQNNWNIGLIA
jgi:ABC-2 type transport system ATP-binding protein